MAEQAQLLKSTLENMTEGVALINENNELETWNQQFLEFAGLQESEVRRGDKYDDLLANSELHALPALRLSEQLNDDGFCETEVTMQNGCVLLFKSHLIPSGGMLNTFTDITERSHHQRALQAVSYTHLTLPTIYSV